MELLLQRYLETKEFTLGFLRIVSGNILSHTLEDPVREVKIPEETCIPPGRYRIGVRREGSLYKKFDAAYKDISHDGMLWIMEVPDFEWIYFHTGHTVRDTLGCPLTAEAVTTKGKLYRSRIAYRNLYHIVHPFADARDCWLNVKGAP